ncbi:MAG TPA: hypothetical protein VF029_06980 [Actinomycetota bacterium]
MSELTDLNASRVLRGKQPTAFGRAPATAEGGRVCKARGCRTVLSMYNTGDRCWEHTPRTPYLFNVRRFRTPDVRRTA